MARVDNPRKVNRIVARQAKPATHERALEIGMRAEANLTRHRDQGRHRIEVDEGRRSDAFVTMTGRNALSVEVGHWTGYKRRVYVPGLRILRDAAGI